MNWNSPFSIRPYVITDYTALLTVIDIICSEGKWTYTSQFQPTPAWRHALETPNCPCHLLLVVCDHDETVIGWCDLFPGDVTGEANLGIGLLTAYRNRGIGTTVLQRVLAWVQDQKLDKINLVVNAENTRAIHLYEKFSFQITETIDPPFPAAGEWLEMQLNLTQKFTHLIAAFQVCYS